MAEIEEKGKVETVLCLTRNITHRKEMEGKNRYLNFHDRLTGLYNRSYFMEEMKRLDSRNNLPLIIMMGDINGFKLVNDALGTEEGDRLLKLLASVLQRSCRSQDLIARWGGDEFIILLPAAGETEASEIGNRIQENYQELADKDLPISISIGWATKNHPSEEMEGVIQQAADSMYSHKLLENKSTRGNILKILLYTLGEKSNETEKHTLRAQRMALEMGEVLELTDQELNDLSLLISLHDIGKITVPEKILTKSGRLTEEEWEIIKTHPRVGHNIALASGDFAGIAKAILSHHEWWDGSGYPQGLQGEEIPLISRIAAIVDAFDVMTNGRPYKEPMSQQEALEEIRCCAGTQFDPRLAETFIGMMKSPVRN